LKSGAKESDQSVIEVIDDIFYYKDKEPAPHPTTEGRTCPFGAAAGQPREPEE
jgi:hypothetical protein